MKPKSITVSFEKYMMPCMSKSLFGIDCPGCGLQRASILLSRGEFLRAFEMYPAIYTSLLFCVFLGLHFFDKSRDYSKIIIHTAIANAVIIIVSYIYKITNI